MTDDKLKQIIERENENLEQRAVDEATRIISAISQRRQQIQNYEAEIAELQADLKKIEITKHMPITIKGIRVTSMTVDKNDDGTDRIACNYELLSSEDKVLAKQGLTSSSRYGGGGDTTFVPPTDVIKQIADAATAYRKSIEQHLGIT